MKHWLLMALAAGAFTAQAETLNVTMHEVDADGTGDKAGTVQIETNQYGLVFRPDLSGLEPGIRGFHIHTNGDCGPAENNGEITPAGAAGGHWDPKDAGKHGEPWGEGHMGDLPALLVDRDGNASQPVQAPRLHSLGDIRGLALMVHEGGDNHADHPKPLGGGGGRVLCGVIE